MAKFFSAGQSWKAAHIVAAGQVLMDEGMLPSTIAAAINQIVNQISLIARELNGYTVTGAVQVLNEATIAVSTAAQILNNDSLWISHAASILNNSNLGISRAASILNDVSISESRIISILGDSAITASRAASILADANFTHRQLLFNTLWNSYKSKFNSIYDSLGYSATKFCYGFSTCGSGATGTTERFDDVANSHTARANATARSYLAGYAIGSYGFSTCGSGSGNVGTTERFDDVANTHTPRANATARSALAGYSVPWKRY